ncbi:MAG: TolC family protein, partial [Desulfobacterales bacterium]
MTRQLLRNILLRLTIGLILFYPYLIFGEDPANTLTLQQTINAALEANLGLLESIEEVKAAQENKKARITEFFPTLNARYNYIYRDSPTTQALGTQQGIVDVLINPDEEYNFVTSFSQPLFTGFALLNQYKIASMGLDVAEFRELITRQDVILDAKNAYFSILKAAKLVDVAEDNVKQITAQKEVAENMYQVGMSPLNDLLQSQVQLANAKQQLITAINNLDVAKSQFNTLLRRPVNTPVAIADILDYTPFEQDINYCLAYAEDNREEIDVADLEVQIAEKDYNLTKRDYYPTVNLTGTHTQRGTDWEVNGGTGIADKEFWDIRATATWDFWQWGRTTYGVREKLNRIAQAKYRKEQILDNIELQVKEAYLRTKESEKNITTVEKAI